MANTYTQIYLHIIFSVKNRYCAIPKEWRVRLHEYIGGVILKKEYVPLIVDGTSDHVHILLILNKNITIPALVGEIKSCATNWVNKNAFVRGHFEWQDGYGAFSVSQGLIEKVTQYIANQEIHRRKITFRKEFEAFLSAYQIKYDSKYLPNNPE